MVKITVDIEDMTILMTGHAGAGTVGNDPVCAAVTMVYRWLIYSLEELNDRRDCVKKLAYTEKPGDCSVHAIPKEWGRISVRDRFMFAKQGFELLEDHYPNNVQLEVL